MEASIIKEKKFYGGSNCEWFATELLCELGIIKYEFDGENQVEILKSIGVDEIKLITERIQNYIRYGGNGEADNDIEHFLVFENISADKYSFIEKSMLMLSVVLSTYADMDGNIFEDKKYLSKKQEYVDNLFFDKVASYFNEQYDIEELNVEFIKNHPNYELTLTEAEIIMDRISKLILRDCEFMSIPYGGYVPCE